MRAYHGRGDRAARERLIELYLPLVRTLARRFAHRGERLDDLVQVGSIGLIESIERFDPERGTDFSSFAIATITGEIKNHLRDRTAVVRVPRRLAELTVALHGAQTRLAASLARAPTLSELARETGTDECAVQEAIETERARRPVPFSTADEDGWELRAVARPDDPFGATDDRLLLAAGFRTLGDRERRILHLRFFVGLSQAEIAQEVGLSQIQVSRLIRTSLERLRGALEQKRARVADPHSLVKL
jgi:RNA polymerase sigma-B factor